MLSVLGGGAFGMFLFAVATGKEQVHNLHPIFQIGAAPPGDLHRETYIRKMSQTTEANGLDFERMHQTRVTRRTTLNDSFQKTGLSDSHGGHWYNDEEEEESKKGGQLDVQRMLQSRKTRRRVMEDSFQKSGLSDAHGGRWQKDN